MCAYELLSPAGDMEKLKAALRFGADAVYCGGPSLHLRAAPADFSMESLHEAVDYVHARKKKIYVTVNAFPRNEDFSSLPAYLRALRDMKVDAVIVSDLGILDTAAREAPGLAVHVSTQSSCLNYASARVYHRLGARRIILARELSLPEIARIREETPPELELEAFVHGAMCMAYSGRCLISGFLTGRDSNRGGCAQPCRWSYRLIESKRPGESFPIEETEEGTAILSSRDLNALSFLDELKKAGIVSFKIEGRMKSPYYVATVTGAYRRALDHSAPLPLLEKELRAASHREYSSGFYFGSIRTEPPASDGYTQECLFVGVVLERREGMLLVEQRGRFSVGDTLEVLSPNMLGQSFPVTAITDTEGVPADAAVHPLQKILLPCPLPLEPGDMLRLRLSGM